MSQATSDNANTVLVTGASGHLGRRAVELLLLRGDVKVIAASRTPDKLADLAAQGAELRRLDFDDDASLSSAFADVQRVLLVSTDDISERGKRFRQQKRALDAMVKAGVKHVVYTSLTAPDASSPIGLAFDHRETEAALEKSGLGYTVLRNNLYAENLLGSLPQAIGSGALHTAAGTRGAAYVTREDCAQAAAAALAATFDGKRTFDISGPASVTQEEIAAVAAHVAGKPVTAVALDDTSLRAGLAQAGLPPAIIDLVAGFDAAVAEGRMDVRSSAVKDLTGKEPQSVAAFLAAVLPSVLSTSKAG